MIGRCIAWSLLLTLLAISSAALAQPEEVPPPPAEEDLAARLTRLEEQARERDAQLARALARVEELEQRAAPPAEAEEAEVAAEGDAQGAEEDDAQGAEEEDDAAEPVMRPLANLFTRFEHREGYDRAGVSVPIACVGVVAGATDGDCIRYRARVGFEIEPLEIARDVRVSVRFLPQVAGHWAMPNGGSSTSGGFVDPVLGLHEGFLSLHLGEAFRVDVGRFEMVYGEHLTIGNLDWHPNGRAFDGARARFQPVEDGLFVDGFWTITTEGGLPAFGENDQYFYGLYAGLGPAIAPGLALDAYALVLQNNDSVDLLTGAERDFSLRLTLGGRFRHRVELIDLRVESALQVGTAGQIRPADPQVILAGHVDAEVGLNLLDDRLRFALEGLFASGDGPSPDVNEAYNQLFPTGHLFLGLSDVMGGRSNVASGVLHITGKPLPQLAIQLDWHVFARPERPAGAVDNYAGTEGDLNVIWTPAEGLRGRVMYALFIPNAGFFPTDEPIHYLEIELGYVLK
jgi:hypothetical protein